MELSIFLGILIITKRLNGFGIEQISNERTILNCTEQLTGRVDPYQLSAELDVLSTITMRKYAEKLDRLRS